MRALVVGTLFCVLGAFPALAQPGDLAQVVFAPARIPLSQKVKVGYRYEQTTEVETVQKETEWLAVVGETKDAWEIETNRGLPSVNLLAKGAVLAIVVDKKTCRVIVARLGRPGQPFEDLKELQIKEPPNGEWPPKPAREVSVEIGSERVAADLYLADHPFGGKLKTYVGKKGTPLEAVLLKFEGRTSYALRGKPKQERFDLEKDTDEKGKPISIEVLRAEYTNGESRAIGKHPVARAFRLEGKLELESSQGTIRVVSLRADAKKSLAWK